MTTTDLRKNSVRLPASLTRRNQPVLTTADLATRSPVFRALEAPVLNPGPRRPRIISSAHGPIKHLLLTYPAYADGEYSYRTVYQDLFTKLPRRCFLTILCHPSVEKDLQDALEAANVTDRAEIVEAPEYLEFTVWAEDPYIVVQDLAVDPPTIFFVEPYTFTRVGDAVISELVAEATPLQDIKSPLYFQGGNVLIGDDFVLIGADYPAKTLELIQRYEHMRVPEGVDLAQFVKDTYQKTFDPKRQIFYVGTKLPVPQYQKRQITLNGEVWNEEIYLGTGIGQPIFHIDMFISLAGRTAEGKYRLLVGSPVLADKLLGRAPISYAMDPIFDDIARFLERQGFEVIRNPLPITYVDDDQAKLRTWYFATANNSLVQIDPEAGNQVWLPTYGHGPWADLAAIDAENRRIWESLSFSVHQLADFNPFAQNLGSIHCIKKYLER